MKKKLIISLFVAAAMSVSSFVAFAEEGTSSRLSAELTPVLSQIQNGTQLALRTYIKNTSDISGDIAYKLVYQDAEGNEVYSLGSTVELSDGEETSFATTINRYTLNAGDKIIVLAMDGDDTVLDEEEVTLINNIAPVRLMSANDEFSALPIDEELDNAWNKLSNVSDTGKANNRRKAAAAATTSLSSRHSVYYGNKSSDGYSEGLLKTGTMYFESLVTNSGSTSETAVVYTASYTSSGALYALNEMTRQSVAAGNYRSITSTLSMTTSLYNSIGSVKYYTWTDSMEPCGDAATYTKSSHNDNLVMGSSILTKADNYPMFTNATQITLNGSLTTSSDVDVIAYKSSSSRTLTIKKPTTPGGTFKVDVYNSSGSLVSSNPSSYLVSSGSTYYLKIYGTKAGNYTIKLNQ